MDSIDYGVVRRYFEKTADDDASATSYMAHDHDLPKSVVEYRFAAERERLEDWLDAVPATAGVLDVGCGAGAWTHLFAQRFGHVVGIEASHAMVEAAQRRNSGNTNVEITMTDVRAELPEGEFQLAFLGGLCMYLNDPDAVDLLQRIRARLGKDGVIILRESTARTQRRTADGDYGALYRTVEDYHELFSQAGFSSFETRRNWGYTAMEIAIELVNARRRWLPFLPKRSSFLASLTWTVLRASKPVSLIALPRLLDRINISWPSLQNHFFRLRTTPTSSGS